MDQLLKACKALAEPARFRILMLLRQGELCVCELCDVLRLTQSTASTHLRVLRDAGFICGRRVGKWMYYTLSTPGAGLLSCLDGWDQARLSSAPRLNRDRLRLNQRLALRSDGSCCLGFSKPGRNPRKQRRTCQ